MSAVRLEDLIPGNRIKVLVKIAKKSQESPVLKPLMGEQVVTVVGMNPTLVAVDCVFKGCGVSYVFQDEILEFID